MPKRIAPSRKPATGNGRRLAFAPRERDGTDTATSVTRDSRRRRYRQFALAAVIGCIVVLFARLIEFENAGETEVQLGVETASVSQEGTVSIEGLSFQGVTDSGRDFAILADRASESTDRPDLVTLVSFQAEVDTAAGHPITIRSDNGELLRSSNTVNLSGDVVIVRPDLGYTLMTEEAFADLNSGELVSTVPVRGTGPDGSVDAGGIIISGNEEGIVFTGRTTLVINSGPEPAE